MKLNSAIIGALALSFIISGCATIKGINQKNKSEIILPGICNDDLNKIKEAYSAVNEGMTKDEVSALCLNPNAPKIKSRSRLSGSDAVKYFGTESMRPDVQNPEQIKKYLLEMQRFEAWVFPYVNLKGKEDDGWFDSGKKEKKSGPEHYFAILFYDNIVLTKKHSDSIKESIKEEKKSMLGTIASTLFNAGLKFAR